MAATKKAMDFTNVKEGGIFNPRRREPGDYRAKIVKVDDYVSKKDNPQWLFTIKLTDDARASYPYYCGQDADSAWKVRNLFIAAGMQVPKKRVMVDPNKIVGKEIGVSLEDDEYEGKMKSVIQATFPVSELEEDEEPAPPKRSGVKKATSTKKAAQVDEDESDDEDEDLEELDLDEL